MAITYNIISDKTGVKEKLYANAICLIGEGRDGTLLNVIDNKKYSVASLDESDLTPDKYPIFGRKMGKLNKVDGYTLSIDLKETLDGKWCHVQKDDFTYQLSTDAIDENGDLITTGVLVEYSKLPIGISWDSSSNSAPEWKET